MIHFCLNQRLETLRRKSNRFHLKALLRKRYQGNHRQIFKKMTRLLNLNRPKDLTTVPISLEMRMIQFFENFPGVLLMAIMVNGQVLQSIYNQGHPASTQHRRMFWHVKNRKTMAPQEDHWYTNTDDQLMEEYIARHKDEFPLKELEDIKDTCEYS